MNAFGKFGNSNWEMPGAACSSSQKFTLGLCVWCSGTGYLDGIHSLSPRLHDPESHGNVSHGPVFPLPAPPSVCLSESNPGANAPSALFTWLHDTHTPTMVYDKEREKTAIFILFGLSSGGSWWRIQVFQFGANLLNPNGMEGGPRRTVLEHSNSLLEQFHKAFEYHIF